MEYELANDWLSLQQRTDAGPCRSPESYTRPRRVAATAGHDQSWRHAAVERLGSTSYDVSPSLLLLAPAIAKISPPQPYTSHLIYTQTHKSQVVAMGGGAAMTSLGRPALMMVTSIMTSVRTLPPSVRPPTPSRQRLFSPAGRRAAAARSASIAVGCLRGQDEREPSGGCKAP